jgi:hypothetical protein
LDEIGTVVPLRIAKSQHQLSAALQKIKRYASDAAALQKESVQPKPKDPRKEGKCENLNNQIGRRLANCVRCLSTINISKFILNGFYRISRYS